MGASPYRPSAWGSPAPQRIMITFPGQGKAANYSAGTGVTASLPNSQTNYVFDAVIVAAHHQELRRTEHPVQTGANISDHAYIVPAKLVLDVGMSDAMDAYFKPSTWSGSPSKSVSAFQTMLALQFSRIPLSITTRLRAYSNMVIEALSPEETVKSATGLRMRIEFGQIFMASIAQSADSARPQDTGTTDLGSINTQPPTSAQISQNNVSGLSGVPVVPSDAIGAGAWSSVNTDNLQSLPAGR